MKVTCPNCSFVGNIKDELIPEAGRNVTCPKCKTLIFVKKPDSMQFSVGEGNKESIKKASVSNIKCPNLVCGKVVINTNAEFCPECGTVINYTGVENSISVNRNAKSILNTKARIRNSKRKYVYILASTTAIMLLILCVFNYINHKNNRLIDKVFDKYPDYSDIHMLCFEVAGGYDAWDDNKLLTNAGWTRDKWVEKYYGGEYIIGLAKYSTYREDLNNTILILNVNDSGFGEDFIFTAYLHFDNTVDNTLPKEYKSWSPGSEIIFTGKFYDAVTVGKSVSLYFDDVSIEYVIP